MTLNETQTKWLADNGFEIGKSRTPDQRTVFVKRGMRMTDGKGGTKPAHYYIYTERPEDTKWRIVFVSDDGKIVGSCVMSQARVELKVALKYARDSVAFDRKRAEAA